MRISAKGRYAMAAMIYMTQNYNNGNYIKVINISEKLGISNIYLEQVFSLLKRGGLVTSFKGSQGGYLLTRTPQQITAYDILSSVETSLFENTEETVSEKVPEINAAMQKLVFNVLDEVAKTTLKRTTLYDLVQEAEKHTADKNLMFFI